MLFLMVISLKNFRLIVVLDKDALYLLFYSNLFINDVLDNCDKYGVYLDSQYCCGGLFADDIVLVAPSKQVLKKILNKVHEWAIKNEMTFGINKCATLVVKPINFVKPINYEDPSFFIGSNKLPKTDNYTYLGIPFDESLSLKPIQSKLNSNLNCQVKIFVLSISY